MKSYADFLLHPLRFLGSKSLATTCDFFTSILHTAQFGFLENRTKRQQRTRPRVRDAASSHLLLSNGNIPLRWTSARGRVCDVPLVHTQAHTVDRHTHPQGYTLRGTWLAAKAKGGEGRCTCAQHPYGPKWLAAHVPIGRAEMAEAWRTCACRPLIGRRSK